MTACTHPNAGYSAWLRRHVCPDCRSVLSGSRPNRIVTQREGGHEDEAAFQSFVRETAELFGWRSWHEQDSRRDNPGLPDLILLHRATGRVLWVELKAEGGVLSLEQLSVLEELKQGGHDVRVWWPKDRPEIEAELDMRGIR